MVQFRNRQTCRSRHDAKNYYTKCEIYMQQKHYKRNAKQTAKHLKSFVLYELLDSINNEEPFFLVIIANVTYESKITPQRLGYSCLYWSISLQFIA